jgi:hypothetical protein
MHVTHVATTCWLFLLCWFHMMGVFWCCLLSGSSGECEFIGLRLPGLIVTGCALVPLFVLDWDGRFPVCLVGMYALHVHDLPALSDVAACWLGGGRLVKGCSKRCTLLGPCACWFAGAGSHCAGVVGSRPLGGRASQFLAGLAVQLGTARIATAGPGGLCGPLIRSEAAWLCMF